MRPFVITFEGQPIGSTDLEFLDSGMGVAHGRFHPEPAYDTVRPTVVRLAEARHARRHDPTPPEFTLLANTGEVVKTSAIAIDDFEDVVVDPEVTAWLDDREQFLRLLGGVTPG